MPSPRRILVTGVLGCLGAWTAREALADGDEVVGFDLGEDLARLRLVLGDDAARVTLVRGDITDLDAVERVLDEHEITRVVHLAALQVPFVRANPPLGMRVNVAGTVNVLEAVAAGSTGSRGSPTRARPRSTTPPTPRPRPRRAARAPTTLYGVSKLADEGMARVYAADAGLASVGLRPYVVYGPGRDQGMTSGPTAAMLAAVRGEPYTIGFSGTAQYDYAPDVARAFLLAADAAGRGGGRLQRAGRGRDGRGGRGGDPGRRPGRGARLGRRRAPVPGRARVDGVRPRRRPFPRTTLADGVAATIAHFRAQQGSPAGRLTAPLAGGTRLAWPP